MRLQGDPSVGPNPCVAPIEHGPFYAVEVAPGSFGTFAGIAVTAQCQVCDVNREVIEGLYAIGNDALSPFAGHYPAGGSNLGPAMAFGYAAGCHIAEVPL